jgi:hypothetical protein
MARRMWRKGLLVSAATIALGLSPNVAFSVCGDGAVEEGEQCDDGSVCTGAEETLGDSCSSDDDCGEGGTCRPTGGDGCASNCTNETSEELVLGEGSLSTIRAFVFPLQLPLGGSQTITRGELVDGKVPVVIRAEDILFDPVMVPGILCACPRGVEVVDFGPGISAEGEAVCGDAVIDGINYLSSQDHHLGEVGVDGFTEEDCIALGGSVEEPGDQHPGVCNSGRTITFEGVGTAGAAIVNGSLAIGTISGDGGTCCTVGDPGCPADPEQLKGPDGIPCTDDDDPSTFGAAQVIPNTTGSAEAEVLNANNIIGDKIGRGGNCLGGCNPFMATGAPIDCVGMTAAGSAFAGAFPAFDIAPLGDFIVTSTFRLEAAAPACVGDCNGDGQVTVDELITGVNIALGSADLDTCPVFDSNGDGSVTVDELITAVNNALLGCPD